MYQILVQGWKNVVQSVPYAKLSCILKIVSHDQEMK